MGLKDFYYGLEDGYYGLLDKLDERIPVYAVVDPIDKIVPSFLVILVLMVAVIGWLAFSAASGMNTVSLNAAIVDSSENPVPNLSVTLNANGQETRQNTGLSGKAAFLVPKNSRVTLSVELEGYETINEQIDVAGKDVQRQFVLKRIVQTVVKTVQFVNESNLPISKKIKLHVACSQPGIPVAQEEVETDNRGSITLQEPANCGNLRITVLDSGYEMDSFTLENPASILELQATRTTTEPPPNQQNPIKPLRIRLESETGSLFTDVLIQVSLYKEEFFVQSKETNNGYVAFDNLEAGIYRVTVSDPEGAWASDGKENIEVNSDSPQDSISVALSRAVQMNLEILAVDSADEQPIPGATIVITNKETGQELKRETMNDDGDSIPFSSLDKIELAISAMAEGFVSETIETEQASGSIHIELEKIIPATSATVFVKVIDSLDDPVPNAKVYLRYADTLVIAPYPTKMTDINGMVKFEGVREEELFAYAEKYPGSGSSEPKKVELGTENEFEIIMDIGTTEITINAFDDKEQLVPNSQAELWDVSNHLLGTIPLANGSEVYKTKADKRIYLKIKNPDYLTYQSETFQLFKDNPRTINAVLSSRLLGGGPKAKFIGVFDQENQPVTKMQAGGNYFLRMELRVPEDTQYNLAGIHFRVGASNTLENDNMIITQVNVGNAQLTKGSTFNPPKGQSIDLDSKNLSNGDAKWAEFAWSRPKPGAYSAVIGLHVRKETVLNTPIPFYYRAWAMEANGKMLRDPTDDALGQNYETPTKQALYANAHAVVSYFEGKDAECSNDFCFSNFRVKDLKEGLYLLKKAEGLYELRINKKFQFTFVLTNNSPANLEGALLSIRALKEGKSSNDLQFNEYHIINASDQKFESNAPASSEIGLIGVGEFKPNTAIQTTLDFTPISMKATSIEIQIVHNGEILVSKLVDFETVSDKKMKIGLEPAIVGAFTPTPLTVHVTLDEPESPDDGMDLPEVLVTRTIETIDHTKLREQKTTNSRGMAQFDLPPLYPATKIKFEAEKPDYYADAVDIKVDGNLLEFEPEQLESNLKPAVNPEETLTVTAHNKLNADLTITNIRWMGNFSPALDKTKMDNYLKQMLGKVFRGNEDTEIQIAKTALNEAYPIFQPETVKLTIFMETAHPNITQRLPFKIDVTITIGMAGVPTELECLTVDEPEWLGTTQNNAVEHTFNLLNNCKVEGKRVVLSNLQAVLEWKGNSVGNIDLSLAEGSNENSANTQTLLPGEETILFDETTTGTSYYGKLSFIPKSEKLGKTADFTITFFAEAQTDSGIQKVSSNPITGKILIASLETCLSYGANASLSSGGEVTITTPSNSGSGTNGTSGSNNGTTRGTGTGTTRGTGTGGTSGTTASNNAVLPSIAQLQEAGSDAEEIFVKVPYGQEGSLTIDSTNCGDIALDVALCLNDPGCAGGATEGKLILSSDQFRLTPEKPSKTIRVKGDDVAGIYGITVHVKPPGKDYQRVGIIDTIVDPAPEEFFLLDKYELFLKGIGTKDSAKLINNHFTQMITVDAPAGQFGNMKDPNDKSAFDSMLPLLAAGLVPQMLPPLFDAMKEGFNQAKDLADQKFGEFEKGLTETKTADGAVNKLGEQCAPGEAACNNFEKARKAIKTATEKPKNDTTKETLTAIDDVVTKCNEVSADLAAVKELKDIRDNGKYGGKAIQQDKKDCDSLKTILGTGDGSIAKEKENVAKNFGNTGEACKADSTTKPPEQQPGGEVPPSGETLEKPPVIEPPTNTPSSEGTGSEAEKSKKEVQKAVSDTVAPEKKQADARTAPPDKTKTEESKPPTSTPKIESNNYSEVKEQLKDMGYTVEERSGQTDLVKDKEGNLVGEIGGYSNPSELRGPQTYRFVPNNPDEFARTISQQQAAVGIQERVQDQTLSFDKPTTQSTDGTGKGAIYQAGADGKRTHVGEYTVSPDGKTAQAVVVGPTGQPTRYEWRNDGQTPARPTSVWNVPGGNGKPDEYVSFNELPQALKDRRIVSNTEPTWGGLDKGAYTFADGTIAFPQGKKIVVNTLPATLPNDHSPNDTYRGIVAEDGTIMYERTRTIIPGLWNQTQAFVSNRANPLIGQWVVIGSPLQGNQIIDFGKDFDKIVQGYYTARTQDAYSVVQIEQFSLQAQNGGSSPPAGSGAAGGTDNALALFNAACTEYNKAKAASNSATENYKNAYDAARFKKSSEVSSAAKAAGEKVRSETVPKLGESSTKIGTGDSKIKESAAKVEEAKKGLEEAKRKTACAETELKNAETVLGNLSTITAQQTAENTVIKINGAIVKTYSKEQYSTYASKATTCKNAATPAKTKVAALKKTMGEDKTKIESAAKATETAQNDVKDGGNILKLSRPALDNLEKAKQSSDAGSKAMNDVSAATPQLSTNNSGANSGALSNSLAQATQMGLMAAAMGSFMGNNSDGEELSPAEQPRVQSACQVFNLNTRKDMKAILLDKEGINVAMDPEDHKVYGDNATQKVGIDFENQSLAESEPTYGTVTFSATNHRFSPVERIPVSDPVGILDSCWGADFLADKEPYTQKFHLRFITGDFVQPIPPIDSTTFSCTQGAMVGRTGEGALPRVLLSWKWNDVTLDLCDGKNENYKYCDAVQFAMLVSKRLNALQGFLDANPNIPCPTNPFETQLNESTAPLIALTGENPFLASNYVEGCWLPESTELFDGYPSLLYYVEPVKDNIVWTADIKNMQDLKELLMFDAYLIRDGFSDDFLKDFSRYYTSISFADTPSFFHQDVQRKNLNKYFEQKLISFDNTGSDQLPTSGLYQADLIIKYGRNDAELHNSEWKLFDESGSPIATVKVNLRAVRQTPSNSPFYYLPFDGLVGIGGSKLERNGYGLVFDVSEQEAFSLSRAAGIKTTQGPSSNPVQVVKVTRENALQNLNSRATQRGFVLDVESTGANKKTMLFTPALATPVLMKITQAATKDSFSAFYVIQESDQPKVTGNNLTYWTGAGRCRDFTGEIVATAFDEKPDRKATENDVVDARDFAYAIDWPKALKGGNVYLKTVFYTPADGKFGLQAANDKPLFWTPDESEQKAVNLGGISGMAFNRQGTTDTDRITALDDLFDLVKQQAICVTNTGVRTSFWWNPKTMVEQKGKTDQSVSEIEKALVAGQSCIG